jgi:hypothetical protein
MLHSFPYLAEKDGGMSAIVDVPGNYLPDLLLDKRRNIETRDECGC